MAIPAGILCGLGFDPIFSALVCLVANATPTAFGSIGIPTITAASVAGLEARPHRGGGGAPAGPDGGAHPLLMVMMTGGGVRALKRVWPVALGSGVGLRDPRVSHRQVCGGGAAGGHRLGSVHGGNHPSLQAAQGGTPAQYALPRTQEQTGLTVRDGALAWSPFILIFVLLLATSSLVPPIHNLLAAVKSDVVIYSGQGPAPIPSPGSIPPAY